MLPAEQVEVEHVSEFDLTWIPKRGDYMRRRGVWVRKPIKYTQYVAGFDVTEEMMTDFGFDWASGLF